MYYPDLPGYPIVYVHGFANSERIYGFPAEITFHDVDAEFCSAEILFLSNVELREETEQWRFVKDELENRFGLSEKFGLDEIKNSTTNAEFKIFFEELWNHVKNVFGNYMPYGRLYERFISIIRFVSAYQPKTGRQSEMRMLYNFVSIFGERIPLSDKWKHFHFFLIPTYDELKSKQFRDFPKFLKLFNAMEKIWKKFFTKTIPINGFTLQSMPVGGSWVGENKDEFIESVLKPLVGHNSFNDDDRHQIERLVDAFNRLPSRTTFFISSVMNIYSSDYDTWTKDDFVYFYNETVKSDTTKKVRKSVGISQKVVACFLQQGFGKKEFIPIDTWIGSLHIHALGIESQENFFEEFTSMGKLERFLWFLSQAKKTNIKDFFDMLWCIRYGDTGNNEIRGANPISCFECKLRSKCPSYNKIKNSNVLIMETRNVIIDDLTPVVTLRNGKTQGGKSKGRRINDASMDKLADDNNCEFICFTENKIPKKIFAKAGRASNPYWKLRDEFSGYLLKGDRYKIKSDAYVLSTTDLISNMNPFEPDDAVEAIDE